jgi:hypothetical protein
VSARRLLLVVGVGRSGTSLLAGILGQVGGHVPQPELEPDSSNPRGFGEPEWVVRFHQRLMRARQVGVHVFDARPAAFDLTAAAGDDPAVADELRAWLAGEVGDHDVVVVKDPRSVWFLGLWDRCAADLGVEASTLTMLRRPSEVIASARASYGDWQTDASRAASWLNEMLAAEAATRGRSRAYVLYEDLLADWDREVRRAGAAIDLPALAAVTRAAFPAADAFVDPGLRRNRPGWVDGALPPALLELIQEGWDGLCALAADGGDAPPVHARLDDLRARYRTLYADAELIAGSSIAAARRKPKPPPARGLRRVKRGLARRARTLRARLRS